MNFGGNQNICFYFLKTGVCTQDGCKKKHIRVCNNYQRGNCSYGNNCKNWHPFIECKWELMGKGYCRNGLDCTFSHNFKSTKSNVCSIVPIKNNEILEDQSINKINNEYFYVDSIIKDILNEKTKLDSNIKCKREDANILIEKIDNEILKINKKVFDSYDEIRSLYNNIKELINERNGLHDKVFKITDSLSKYECKLKYNYNNFITKTSMEKYLDRSTGVNECIFSKYIKHFLDFLKITPGEFIDLFSDDIQQEQKDIIINKFNKEYKFILNNINKMDESPFKKYLSSYFSKICIL